MTTPWTPDHVSRIDFGTASTLPIITEADRSGLRADILYWDMWPIQQTNGRIARINGHEFWMALTAPDRGDPALRHFEAKIRLLERDGHAWLDLGPVLPDFTVPYEREWAGSALVGFLALGYLLAGPNHLLSFLTLQSSRGVQVEAPVATWWLWNNPSGDLNRIYLDAELITYQIRGAGTDFITAWLGLVMYGALAITALLGWLALRKSKTDHDARAAIAWTALTATTDLIVFNKVGSPQYYGWLFVAALLFVVWQLTGWRIVTGWVAVLAFLTQLVYPVFYEGILQAATVPTYVLILRNLVVVGLLVYANVKLTQLSSSSRSSGPTLSRSIKNPS